jgi:hypothetical protein
MEDIPFMDGLQKLHSKQVGWMPTKQLEGKIRAGQVLVAVGTTPAPPGLEEGDAGVAPTGSALGYCIGHDQYFKRDDVGIIYQMNVAPGHQRGLIGAALLKAQFDRSAYGCRLYCCWCAQDIAANRFWEAMGFVPLAYRAGSEKKSRVHIFWQRRIRAGDATTPWWFPAQTSGGSIREDRIVLPIPPGTHWSDAKPLILPAVGRGLGILPEPESAAPRKRSGETPKPRKKDAPPVRAMPDPLSGALFFAPPAPAPGGAVKKKPAREKKPKAKNDPRLIAAARELRDRWLERVNAPGGATSLPSNGKYDVNKALAGPGVDVVATIPALPALPAPIAA